MPRCSLLGRLRCRHAAYPLDGIAICQSVVHHAAGVTESGSRIVRALSFEHVYKGVAECRNCGIRHIALFADLDEKDLGLIHLPIQEMGLDHGAVLYGAEDPGAAVFTIRSGLVKLVQMLPDGTQRIVRLLRPGAVAGLEAMLGQAYEHTAMALQPTEVCRIPREVVERLDRETPRLHRRLLEQWHNSLRQADEWLTELSTGNARQRLARFLLHLSADHPDRPVKLFTREDLGAILGVTLETASRTVSEFKRVGAMAEVAINTYQCRRDRLEAIARMG